MGAELDSSMFPSLRRSSRPRGGPAREFVPESAQHQGQTQTAQEPQRKRRAWAPQEPARTREAPREVQRSPQKNREDGMCVTCGMHPAHDWGRCRRCGNLVRALFSLRRENPEALEDLIARSARGDDFRG